jgi:hypothetical protein
VAAIFAHGQVDEGDAGAENCRWAGMGATLSAQGIEQKALTF